MNDPRKNKEKPIVKPSTESFILLNFAKFTRIVCP